MKVTLNGQSKEFSNSSRLNDIVQQFCQNSNRIIAEVNGEIVKSARWPETEIKEGDTIELVNFVGGG